jgi:hypothetical protein
MRMIMHDWNDEKCGIILRNARAIADKDTKLIIVDLVLTRACREEGSDPKGLLKTKNEAPEPLLANWGSVNGLAYATDLAVSACWPSILIYRSFLFCLSFSPQDVVHC